MMTKKAIRGTEERSVIKRRLLRLALSIATVSPAALSAMPASADGPARLMPPLPLNVADAPGNPYAQAESSVRMQQNPFCLPETPKLTSPIALASGSDANVFADQTASMRLRPLATPDDMSAMRTVDTHASGGQDTSSQSNISDETKLTFKNPVKSQVRINPMVGSMHHENQDLVEIDIAAVPAQKTRFILKPRFASTPQVAPKAQPVVADPVANRAVASATNQAPHPVIAQGPAQPFSKPRFVRPELPAPIQLDQQPEPIPMPATVQDAAPKLAKLPAADDIAAFELHSEQTIDQVAASEPIAFSFSDQSEVPGVASDSSSATSNDSAVDTHDVESTRSRLPKIVRAKNPVKILDAEGWVIPESDTVSTEPAKTDSTEEARPSFRPSDSPIVDLAEPAAFDPSGTLDPVQSEGDQMGASVVADTSDSFDSDLPDPSILQIDAPILSVAPGSEFNHPTDLPQLPVNHSAQDYMPPVAVATSPVGIADSNEQQSPNFSNLTTAEAPDLRGASPIPAKLVSMAKKVDFDERMQQIASEYGIEVPTEQPTSLYMSRAQVKSLTIGGDLFRINVANGKVCNAISVSENEIKLIGAGNGVTRLAVWAAPEGQTTVQARVFEIHVSDAGAAAPRSGNDRISVLNRTVRHAFPDAEVEVNQVGGELVVSGFCMGTDAAKQIIRMVRKTCLMPVKDELMVR